MEGHRDGRHGSQGRHGSSDFRGQHPTGDRGESPARNERRLGHAAPPQSQAHGLTEGTQYFLLVTSDRSYIWKEQLTTREDRQPDAEVPTMRLPDPSLLQAASGDGRALELLAHLVRRRNLVVAGSKPGTLPQGRCGRLPWGQR